MKKYNFLFALIVVMGFFSAQAEPADSTRMGELIAKARQFISVDVNETKKYLDSLKVYLDKHNTYTFQWGEYHKILGIYYYRVSAYDSSSLHYNTAFEKFKTLDNKLEQAKVLVNLSMVYQRQADFEKTIEGALKALRLFEMEDNKKGMGISLNMVGQVYFLNKEYDQALDYFKQYLKNALLATDSVEIASGYGNMGSAFQELKKYDSALLCYHKALTLNLKLNNNYNIGNSYQNIATAFKERAVRDSALFYYQKAIGYFDKVKNLAGITETALNIGKMYNDLGEYKTAVNYLKRAYDLSVSINEKYLKAESLKSLSLAYEHLGNTSLSFQYYKQYDLLNDSILDESERKNIEEINTKYETEKKEQQIALQQAQLSQQQAHINFNYTIITALVISVVFIVIIFMLLRSRARRVRELSVREAFINATISSQETERKRFAQDLHDGMGQLISSLQMTIESLDDQTTTERRLETVTKSEKIMNEMHREIRSIAFNLMPQTLILSGLVPAIKEMATRINETGKITVGVTSFDMPDRLAEVYEISVYRVVQEWINNIMKYAGATKVVVNLVGDKKEISVVVEDNGKGFDITSLNNSPGNGWRNIQSRVKLINGSLNIDSQPERKGSTLSFEFPLVMHQVETKSVNV